MVSLTPFPKNRMAFDCTASYPLEALEGIRSGYESQNQDEKWSMYFEAPWLQIWRPNLRGWYCYALRFDTVGDRIAILESWLDPRLLELDWAGSLDKQRDFVIAFLVDELAGRFLDARRDFKYGSLSGMIYRGDLSFSGNTTSAHELRIMAQGLLVEAARMENAIRPLPTYVMEKSDRFRGCLLGLACGDALGTTVEFKARGTFSSLTDIVGGGPFNLRPGEWTDDTSMALCLAASLTELDQFDAKDQMSRYLRWAESGYMSSNGRCFDIGVAIRSALRKFKQTGDAFSGSTAPDSAGNGCLMRLAPVPMYYYPDRDAAITMSVESARTTHGVLECLEATRLFAAIIFQALAGATKEDVLLGHGVGHLTTSPRLVAIANGAYRSKPSNEIRGSGYVVSSLEAALWCFWTTDSFEQAVLKAANLGEDADTTAAICGQVAGAFYGASAIPGHWINILTMGDEIRDYADRLLKSGEAVPSVDS
jgi:ADP-ribosyl-[dinitrogen reductase] hydrolase